MPDRYWKVLGIAPSQRPPTPHELLGIDPAQTDPEQIRKAAQLRLALTLQFADWASAAPPSRGNPAADAGDGVTGSISQADITSLADEIAAARDLLLQQAPNSVDSSTPPAAEPWWQLEVTPAPLPPTVPPENWWQGAAAEPPPTITGLATGVAPGDRQPAPTVPTVTWWTEEVKAPPGSAPSTTVGTASSAQAWWTDEIKSTATTAAVPIPARINESPTVKLPPVVATSGVSAPLAAVAVDRVAPQVNSSPMAAHESAVAMPPRPTVASAPLKELTPAEAGFEEVQSGEFSSLPHPKSRSRFPWIVVGLLFVVAALGGGAWYLKQQKGAAPRAEFAVRPSSPTSASERVVAGRAPAVGKIEAPGTTKPASGIANREPAVSVVDPPEAAIEVKPKVAAHEPAAASSKVAEFNRPAQFQPHRGIVLSVAASRNQSFYISTSDDRSVYLNTFDAKSHTPIFKFRSEGLAVAIGGDDRLAVFCDGGTIVIYDLAKKVVKKEFENPRGGIECLAVSADGQFVLTGSSDGFVRRWNTVEEKLQGEFDIGEKPTPSSLAVAADGGMAVCGLTDGSMCTWNLAAGREMKRWKAHKGRVNVVAFAPDGKRFASFGEDRVGRVWQGPDGTAACQLAGHKEPIVGAAWCAEGERLVSVSIDQKVHLWNARDGALSDWSATTREKAYSLGIDPQDRFVLVGQSNGIVQLFPLPRVDAKSE